jgi:hypothetical protein
MSPSFIEAIQAATGRAPADTPPGKMVRFATSDKRGAMALASMLPLPLMTSRETLP